MAFYVDDVHGPRELPVMEEQFEDRISIVDGEEVTERVSVGFVQVGTSPNPDCKIPAGAIEITDAQWMEFVSNSGKRRWDNGAVVEYVPPRPPLTLADYKAAFDGHLDAVAQQRQYDNRITIGTYIASSNPQYVAEAQAFIAWRDQALASMFEQLAVAESGGAVPTIEAFIAALPDITWP
ncbi:hypothetical protein AJ87_05900 [Rhizobium yanglingense]|nr:hypothetical protein AJ87_05900 [Rhizobium yanglingense]